MALIKTVKILDDRLLDTRPSVILALLLFYYSFIFNKIENILRHLIPEFHGMLIAELCPDYRYFRKVLVNFTPKLLLVCGLLISSSQVLAQNTIIQNESANDHLALSASATAFSNLERWDSPDHSASSEYNLSLVYKGIKSWPVTLGINAAKDLTGEREFALSDSSLATSTTISKFDNGFKIGLKGSLVLPTSEASRDIQTLNTKLTLGLPISFKASIPNGLSLAFVPQVSIYSHQYQTSLTGSSNYQYATSATGSASYSITDALSVGVSGSYLRYFTYQGNTVDKYSLDENIDYALNDSIGLFIGHSNGGGVLAPNGRNTNIDLYDTRNSVIYGGFNLSTP